MNRYKGLRRAYGGGLATVTLAQIPTVLLVAWIAAAAGFGVAFSVLALLEAALALAAWRFVAGDTDVEAQVPNETAALARLQSDVDSHDARAEAALRHGTHLSSVFAAFGADGGTRLTLVNSAAESLVSTVDDMSRAALRISSEAMSLSVAAEDADRQIAKVVVSGKEFLETIAHIGENASRSAEMGGEVFDLTRATAQTIGELSAASEKIGTMTTLISGIANQTNLLALNATIEAARAGEQGRGFAVVAGEVKNLAKETAKAVAMIAEMVAMIRASSDRASDAITATANSIGSLNQATANIAAAVEERVEAASKMAQSIAKTASNVTFVKSSIGQIETAADEAVQGAGFLRAAATEIVEQAHGVGKQLQRCAEDFAASPFSTPPIPLHLEIAS